MRVIDALRDTIRLNATYNHDVQVAPFCILWPDKDEQWKASIPLLRRELPELITLGPYDLAKRMGPAIWLRCVVSGLDKKTPLIENRIPLLYLPGVSRQELRAVESCPDHLKAIAELQYRGVFWSQTNSKDWTIFAFLVSKYGGLELDVSHDNETRNALMLAFNRLLDVKLNTLRGRRLRKEYFNELASGKDVPKDILLWMEDSDCFKEARDENAWKAFIEICTSQFGFNPERDGPIGAAKLLADHMDSWVIVWNRYREAASRYPSIIDLIKKASPPDFDLFADAKTAEGWPQWNESEEEELLIQLKLLVDKPSHIARDKILELEEKHGERRKLIWAELGHAPLAFILEPLSKLAKETAQELPSGSLKDLIDAYSTIGWKADLSVIQVLSQSSFQEIFSVIISLIRVLYSSWLEDSAKNLQSLVQKSSYPGDKNKRPEMKYCDGTCLVFVDGLRFDTAKILSKMLDSEGLKVEENLIWATLPSITISGKAAVSPISYFLDGSGDPKEFIPGVKGTNYSLKGGYHFVRLLKENGWQILEDQDLGDIKGRAWCEAGNLDSEGHNRGWKMALHIEGLLKEVKERVCALHKAGWQTIKIVTDHGWLLLPGGLPKKSLPSYLTEAKSSRCASIKAGTSTDMMIYPWYWDNLWGVALAPGISCFRAGEEYQHGGLSLQECLTLQLTINYREKSSDIFLGKLELVWKGLRCNVVADGDTFGLMVDIRLESEIASSSVVLDAKPFRDNNTTSVVVENEDLEGRNASLLLIDINGNIVYQMDTIIGG